jgi:hypothetical protein
MLCDCLQTQKCAPQNRGAPQQAQTRGPRLPRASALAAPTPSWPPTSERSSRSVHTHTCEHHRQAPYKHRRVFCTRCTRHLLPQRPQRQRRTPVSGAKGKAPQWKEWTGDLFAGGLLGSLALLRKCLLQLNPRQRHGCERCRPRSSRYRQESRRPGLFSLLPPLPSPVPLPC